MVIHKQENVYVPELIFGTFLTSSNYDDNEKKVTGGRNGFGAKLTNVFSKKFEVECADSKHRKLFKQTYKNNMSSRSDPVVTDFPSEAFDYTCVTFEPDLKKFGMKELDDDIVSLFKRRVYDLAGCSPKSVSIYLNGKKVPIKDFQAYTQMYLDKGDAVNIYEKANPRWEICLSLQDTGSFQQMSFVNNISTPRGGTHCNYVADQIVKRCLETLNKKHK